MKNLGTKLAGCGLIFVPIAAMAYVGPGAGLSLLGALWALIAAIAAAIVFLIAWPVRRMRRRRREAKALERSGEDDPMAGEQQVEEGQPAPAAHSRPAPVNEPRRS